MFYCLVIIFLNFIIYINNEKEFFYFGFAGKPIYGI